MAAPSLISTTATVFDNSTTPKDTASFDVESGDVLVFGYNAESLANTPATPAKQAGTSTIGTVTLEQDVNPGGNACRTAQWTCSVTGTGTLTIRFARSAGTGWFGAYVRVYRGSDGVGTSNKGSGASGASTATLAGVAADSAIDMVQGDWNAAATTGKTYRTADAGTFTEHTAVQTTNHTIYHGHYANVGGAGTKAVGMTAPSQAWSVSAVEVLGSSVALQAIRPDADLDTAGWTTTPLFSKVNDESDATIIQATCS